MYPNWSRLDVSALPATLVSTLLSDAIKSNRFFNQIITPSDKYVTEGIDPCIGPNGFDKELLDKSPIGEISYETLLILPYLMRINKSLEKFGIQTVQSQPSYYMNSPGFEAYFQNPYVDFEGTVDAIQIYERMKSDKRLSKCYFNTFYTTHEEKHSIRFYIGRPFIDLNGTPNSGFADDDFWEIICTIAEEIGTEKKM